MTNEPVAIDTQAKKTLVLPELERRFAATQRFSRRRIMTVVLNLASRFLQVENGTTELTGIGAVDRAACRRII
jgi:hypothetical protein